MPLTKLINAHETHKLLEDLIDCHEHIYLAVAWGSCGPATDSLVRNAEKFKAVIFGASFCQTDPNLIDKLVEVNNAYIAKPDRGILHSKMYLFVTGNHAEAVVGSSNFTDGGLRRNYEANLHVRGKKKSDALKTIRESIKSYREFSIPITRDIADKYRQQFNAAKRYKRPPDPQFPGDPAYSPQLDSDLAQMTWQEYIEAVRPGVLKDFDGRLEILREVQKMFAGVGAYRMLSPIKRRAVAGTMRDSERANREIPNHDWRAFGSMKGNGQFRRLVNNNNADISRALQEIPPRGEVSEEQYSRFRSLFRRAFRGLDRVGGVPTASRLLAMKRPDTFVCVSGRNKDGIAEALSFRPRALDLDSYWDLVVEPIRTAPWYNEPRPSGHDAELWDVRVAMLDSIYYSAP